MEDSASAQKAARKALFADAKARGILAPFIGKTYAIDDYDEHDRDLTLEAVVQSRVSGTRVHCFPLLGGDAGRPLAEINPRLLETAEMLLENAPEAEREIQRTPCRKRPPSDWVPPLERLFLYQPAAERIQFTPEMQHGLCFQCGSAFGLLKPRRCEYTGRYFCRMCFPSGAVQSIVPARIVAHWDFTECDVCPRAATFIAKIRSRPLIDIAATHPELYDSVPVLRDTHIARQKLFFLKDLVLHCSAVPARDPARSALNPVQSYLYTDIDIYSLDDLVHLERLLGRLIALLEAWVAHVAACPECQTHGATCPLCENKEKLFTFQILDVAVCPTCSTLYHRKCFKTQGCPKCKGSV